MLSTGGSQRLGRVSSGYLVSEPGFELQFNGSVKYASNFLTSDPGSDGVSHPAFAGEIYPENGDTPFLMRIGGIERISQQEIEIITSNTSTGLSVPYGYAYSGRSVSYRVGVIMLSVVNQSSPRLSMAETLTTQSCKTTSLLVRKP